MAVHTVDMREIICCFGKLKVRAGEKHFLGKLFVPSVQKVGLNADAMLDTSQTISLS